MSDGGDAMLLESSTEPYECIEMRRSMNARLISQSVCYHRCICGHCTEVECARCGKILGSDAYQPRRRKTRLRMTVAVDDALARGVTVCAESMNTSLEHKDPSETNWRASDTVVVGSPLSSGMMSFSSAHLDDTGGTAKRRRVVMGLVAERAMKVREIEDPEKATEAMLQSRVLVMSHRAGGKTRVRLATPAECRRLIGVEAPMKKEARVI